jgi:hypothetical protein
MTDQKPDGYIAWHPEHGHDSATEDGGVFVAESPEQLRLSDNSPFSKRLRKDGWRIRPCKIVFLDEDQP